MRRSAYRLCAFAALCLLPACGDGAVPSDPNLAAEVPDLQPERIALMRKAWRMKGGGAAEQRGGLFIDLESGGWMRTQAKRAVIKDTEVMLAMRLDANGDQRLELRLIGGCDGKSEERVAEESYLESGLNRVELSQRFEAAHECLVIELHAESGPVSLLIQDAILTWEQK